MRGGIRYSKTMKEFFEKRIIVPDNRDECWVWSGIRNDKGYGRIRREGKKDGEQVQVNTYRHGL